MKLSHHVLRGTSFADRGLGSPRVPPSESRRRQLVECRASRWQPALCAQSLRDFTASKCAVNAACGHERLLTDTIRFHHCGDDGRARSLCVLPSVSALRSRSRTKAVSLHGVTAYLSIVSDRGAAKRQLARKRIFLLPWRSWQSVQRAYSDRDAQRLFSAVIVSFINSPPPAEMRP